MTNLFAWQLGIDLDCFEQRDSGTTPYFKLTSDLTKYLKERARENNANLIVLSNEEVFERRGVVRFRYDYDLRRVWQTF